MHERRLDNSLQHRDLCPWWQELVRMLLREHWRELGTLARWPRAWWQGMLWNQLCLDWLPLNWARLETALCHSNLWGQSIMIMRPSNSELFLLCLPCLPVMSYPSAHYVISNSVLGKLHILKVNREPQFMVVIIMGHHHNIASLCCPHPAHLVLTP